MPEMTRRMWLAAAGLASAAAGAVGGLRAVGHPRETNHHVWQKISPRELIQRRHLPNLELITHENRKVRFYHDLVKDKKVVIHFVFTNCEKACPLTVANLVRVQKILHDRIGRDIFLYSITLKPEEDTPQVLKAYAREHGVGPGWLFLTAKPDDIETLRHALGFVSSDPRLDADKTYHIGMLRYGNEPYMRWAACPGQAAPDWIATSILAEMDGPLIGGVRPHRKT